MDKTVVFAFDDGVQSHYSFVYQLFKSYGAGNPNSSAEILEKLSNDKSASVRCYVAENPKTPANVLDRLSNDENPVVRCHIARNPNVSAEIMLVLLRDWKNAP